jgi:hypothetical protein
LPAGRRRAQESWPTGRSPWWFHSRPAARSICSAASSGQYLGAQLGVPVVIEIFPAPEACRARNGSRANPDGYSFLLGSIGTHALNQSLYRHPLYNAATTSPRSP